MHFWQSLQTSYGKSSPSTRYIQWGNESSWIIETEVDCFMPSACIATPSLWELCSSVCISFFVFFFRTDADKHCSWSLVSSLRMKLLILEDHRNSIIACTCTNSKCSIPESSTSFSNTNVIKTHGSESRGQEEATCTLVFWPTLPLQWVIFFAHPALACGLWFNLFGIIAFPVSQPYLLDFSEPFTLYKYNNFQTCPVV